MNFNNFSVVIIRFIWFGGNMCEIFSFNFGGIIFCMC